MKREAVSIGNGGAGALVVGATLLSYLPALRGEFIWNDSDYVTASSLRPFGGLVRIWTELGATEQYYPLLHSAFWLQHRLFGDHPLGYHVVTLLLHAVSAVLFALVLLRLFDRGGAQSDAGAGGFARPPARAGMVPPRPGAAAAWLAALLFALHPVHVESVAWITEQKNTLSMALYLAAVLAYFRFDESRRPGTHLLALAFFVASLACKTVTATLPAALLVAFWWKRGALGWRRDFLPLLPWFVLGAAAGLFSSWVERAYGGAVGPDFQLSLAGRVLVAGRAFWFYAGQLVWPFGLNFIYPRWAVDPAIWWHWAFPLGALAAGAALWLLRRRTRGPLAAFLSFAGSLFPVLGFVNLYGARFSWVWDHWQYLADLGPIALAAAGMVAGWQAAAARARWLGPVLAGALAAGCGGLTWAHCAVFHDDVTLYRTTLARNPGSWMAHYNLGIIWARTPGRQSDAVAEYQAALRLRPAMDEAHNNLGEVLLKMPGRLDDAIAEYEAVLRLKPDSARAHYNLGVALAHRPGRLAETIAEFERAVHLKPDFAEAHDLLGVSLAHLPGRQADARAHFEEAVRLQPESFGAQNNLGLALAQVPGRQADAIAHYREALRLKPDFAPAWYNLGLSLYQTGDLPAAIAAFREVLRWSPNDPAARQALAAALRQSEAR